MIYDRISSNKRNSILLSLFFIILIIGLGWVFGLLFGSSTFGIIIATIIALAMVWGSYYYSDKLVLRISKARPVDRKNEAFLYHTVEGLAIAAGLPKPKCYVIDSDALNAFATGRNPENGVICVTTGLMKKLNKQELEGVIAHEMSHIGNYDIRFMSIITVLVGVTALLSDFILRSFFWGSFGGRRDGRATAIALVLGLVLAILTPIVATIIKLAVSRQREYLADASGALLTRYPEGLASALEKISQDNKPLKSANKATSHLFISNPLKNTPSFLNNLFATHPPIEERIKKLRKM